MSKIENTPGLLSRQSYQEFLECGKKEFGEFDMPYKMFKKLLQQVFSECGDFGVTLENFEKHKEEMDTGAEAGIILGKASVEMYEKGQLPVPLNEDPYFAKMLVGVATKFLIKKVSEYKSNIK